MKGDDDFMVIVAVDPNKSDLKLLVKYLRLAFEDCTVVMFSDPAEAASYMQETPVDVLYTEVVMGRMTGFGLQAAAMAVQPAVLTVFLSDTAEFAQKALQTRAVGYIKKPLTKEAVLQSLDDTKFGRTKAAQAKINFS